MFPLRLGNNILLHHVVFFWLSPRSKWPVQSSFSLLPKSWTAIKSDSLFAPHYQDLLWRIFIALTSFLEETFFFKLPEINQIYLLCLSLAGQLMFLGCPDTLQSRGLFPAEKKKEMKFYSHNWGTSLCRSIIYNIIFNGFSEVICEVIKWQ